MSSALRASLLKRSRMARTPNVVNQQGKNDDVITLSQQSELEKVVPSANGTITLEKLQRWQEVLKEMPEALAALQDTQEQTIEGILGKGEIKGGRLTEFHTILVAVQLALKYGWFIVWPNTMGRQFSHLNQVQKTGGWTMWAYREWTEIPVTESIQIGEMLDAVKTMKQDSVMKKRLTKHYQIDSFEKEIKQFESKRNESFAAKIMPLTVAGIKYGKPSKNAVIAAMIDNTQTEWPQSE